MPATKENCVQYNATSSEQLTITIMCYLISLIFLTTLIYVLKMLLNCQLIFQKYWKKDIELAALNIIRLKPHLSVFLPSLRWTISVS